MSMTDPDLQRRVWLNQASRLLRFHHYPRALLLQEFDYEVIHCPENQHVVADYLFCLGSREPPIKVNDEFLDASLFVISLLEFVLDECHIEGDLT